MQHNSNLADLQPLTVKLADPAAAVHSINCSLSLRASFTYLLVVGRDGNSPSLVCSSSDVSDTPERQIPCYLRFPRLKYIITHLFPLCTITTNVGQLSTDIEEHIVLPGGPFLHKIC